MPKLTDDVAKDVAKAPIGFAPLDAGIYRARLVDVTAKMSSNDQPTWSWKLEVLDEPYIGRFVWINTSLMPAARWKLHETFNAFGVEPDTDTDLLLNKVIRVDVMPDEIRAGPKKGQKTTVVNQALPENPEDEAKVPAGAQATGVPGVAAAPTGADAIDF